MIYPIDARIGCAFTFGGMLSMKIFVQAMVVIVLVLFGFLAPAHSQTASLLPNGEQQFIDANGAPYAGGLVYMYIPHTTTFKNTWQDPNQTTLNTNPVVLDSAGRAIIYGSGTYRQVLQDQFGNTIWDQSTQDVISLITSIGVSTVIAAIPAGSISSTALQNTGVIPGTYNNPTVTVISSGQISVISNGTTPPYAITGLARSLAMSLSSNLSSATFTATQLLVSNGISQNSGATLLNSYSQTLNVATTGNGGCDNGSTCPLASAFLDVYATYNPTLSNAGIIACSDTVCNGSQVYPSTNMSVGATQSALIAILPTDSLKSIVAGAVQDNWFLYAKCPAMFPAATSGTVALARSSILSGVPPEAIGANLFMALAAATTSADWSVAPDPGGTGTQTNQSPGATTGSTRACSGATVVNSSVSFTVPITTSQVLWWGEGATRANENMYITGYKRP